MTNQKILTEEKWLAWIESAQKAEEGVGTKPTLSSLRSLMGPALSFKKASAPHENEEVIDFSKLAGKLRKDPPA